MKNLVLLFFFVCAFDTNAQDSKFIYFISGEIGLTNILIFEHPLYNSEDLGSAARLSGALRMGFRYRCTDAIGLSVGPEFGLTKYGEDHSRTLMFGNGQIISIEQTTSIGSFNLGLPMFLDIRFRPKASFLLGGKYQYNFKGKILSKEIRSGDPADRRQDFAITKNNFSGTIGLQYYPKGTEEIRKNIFLGLSAEYFFIADRMFFALNDVNRFSVNFNVGYYF